MMKYIYLLFCFLSSFSVNGQVNRKPSEILNRLSEAIQFKTVSFCATGSVDQAQPFAHFIEWARKAYPLVHEKLECKVINKYSLLYHWRGLDPLRLPVLFIGHIDVVPVETGTVDKWEHPPYSGHIDNEFIWGRGAIDNKSQVIALLETLEKLLYEGYSPPQALYFAFGHDEECGGERGAGEINKYFVSKQILFDFILDEGGAIIKEALPGVRQTIAFIATAEKGYMDVELFAEAAGGHSSLPPEQNPIDILAKAITEINSHPMPARLHDPTKQMMKSIAPFLSLKNRLAVKHDRLFSKQILEKLSSDPFTNSLIRTVITPTMIHAGIKENVLPETATANLNVRIMPGDSVESVIAYMKHRIKDERVKINVKVPYYNPSAISSINTRSWKILGTVIDSVFPGVTTAPFLFPATTDSHHYTALSKNIYRFIPLTLAFEDREKIHGTGERIGINDYLKSIEFYSRLIRNL